MAGNKRRKKNIPRTMVKMILADGFFPGTDAENLYHIAMSLPFVQKEFGKEIDQFNLTYPYLNEVFSNVLGEKVEFIEEQSGIFRRPTLTGVHFEGFDDPEEWCFIVSLDDTETHFNTYRHASGNTSALNGYNYNFSNFFEWDYDINISLKRNQAVFFRPWLFHSVQDGLIQYYRLRKVK